MLGRFDARFSGYRYEPGTDMPDEYDPSDEAVYGPLAAAFNDYIRRELKFESDLPYELMTDVNPWNFGDAANGFPGTTVGTTGAQVQTTIMWGFRIRI